MEEDQELAELPSMGVRLWVLFWEFTKITTLVLGGGYVILSAAELVFVRKRRWISAQDFLDMVAISQTVPGIIACNGAIYIGWRVARFRGALCALLGTALPPMVVITAIAAGMEQIPTDNPYVSGAFLGVNACVVGLIVSTAWKLGKKALRGWFEWTLALLVLVTMVVWEWNPGYLMLMSVPCGVAYVAWKRMALAKSPPQA